MSDSLRERLQQSLGADYTLERELGGGGMSRVFLAREERLGRDVVVKVLPPEFSESLSVERFAREIRFAAALQEPHIVPVLTAGETSEGVPYYTMPFVRGESLRSRMKQETFSVAAAISVLRDVASALAYAHRQGVVHRDIKPENVLISEGTAVVTDFGIARAIGESRTQDGTTTTLTSAGSAIGTPAYMSPEQAVGDPVDHRTDIYAFGVVAYELLSGAHPFASKHSAQQMIAGHIAETPASPQSLRADLPVHLASLVMRCLEKDPSRRPQNVEEILSALDAVTTPVAASPTDDTRTVDRRRKGPIVGVVALVVVAMAVGVAVYSRLLNGGGAIRSLVVTSFENVGGDSTDAYLAHGITDELTVTLGKLPGMQVAPRASAAAYNAKSTTPAEFARSLGVRGVLSGRMCRGGDRLRVSTELTDAKSGRVVWTDQFEEDSKDVFGVEDRITRAIVSALKVGLAPDAAPRASAAHGVADAEAHDLYLRGRYFWSFRSESGIKRAIDFFSQAVARDSTFVLAISGLADAYGVSAFYSYVPPVEGYGRAKELAQRALRLDSTRAEPHSSLGYVALYFDWDWPEAERQFKRSIQLDSGYATAHQWYGNFLVAMNRPSEAIASLRRAARVDPLNRVTVGAVCWGMNLVRQYALAVAQCGKALEIDSTFALGHVWSGDALSSLGDTAAAFRELHMGVELSHRSAVSVAALALAYARAGRAADARALLSELTSSQRYVPSYEVALVHAALHDVPRSLEWLERAYAERSHSIAFLNVDPSLDPLRSDARFKALVAKAGLR